MFYPSFLFLTLYPKFMVNDKDILRRRTLCVWPFTRPCGHRCRPQCRRAIRGGAHSPRVARQQITSLPGPQSLGWYFPESNALIKVSVQFLCAVHLPEARLILVLIKQFTLVQLSSYVSNPQNVWISPTVFVCFPWDTLGEKTMKSNFLKCWLPLGCGFSYILLWMTSHKSFAWASSTVLICVFQVYDE